jgi:phosphopantetheine--protein transferase-like protein
VSRLIDAPVDPDQAVSLRSVQRAALISFARKENIAVRSELLASSVAFTVRSLLGDGAAPAPSGEKAVLTPLAGAAASAAGSSNLMVGLDIEAVAALPAADDYRTHPFYRDTFTPTEIAHCLLQGQAEASFCGLWAAKEAIIKAGLAAAPDRLSAIEISWDAAGRPAYPGCALSISHTDTTAAAICVAGAAFAAPPPIAVLDPAPVALDEPKPSGGRKRSFVLLNTLISALAGGVLVWFALHQ